MAQEVQTSLNYQAELNQTEWIWYQERRISDKMQVRDKVMNSRYGETDIAFSFDTLYYPSTRDNITTEGGVTYKVSWGNIIIPLAWVYQIEVWPCTTGNPQPTAYYKYNVYVNGKAILNYVFYTNETLSKSVILNLWKKDVVTIGVWEGNVGTTGYDFKLKLTKL